eukprot:bmy_13582T0
MEWCKICKILNRGSYSLYRDQEVAGNQEESRLKEQNRVEGGIGELEWLRPHPVTLHVGVKPMLRAEPHLFCCRKGSMRSGRLMAVVGMVMGGGAPEPRRPVG